MMVDSSTGPSVSDAKYVSSLVDRNNFIKASLEDFFKGKYVRLGIYGASDEVKALIKGELRVDIDELIVHGRPVETKHVNGGVENGGSNIDYLETPDPRIFVELEFPSVDANAFRVPVSVYLVWNIQE